MVEMLFEDSFNQGYFQIKRNMIVVIVSLLIMNLTEVRLVYNLKENCHYGHISFNMKETKIHCFLSMHVIDWNLFR